MNLRNLLKAPRVHSAQLPKQERRLAKFDDWMARFGQAVEIDPRGLAGSEDRVSVEFHDRRASADCGFECRCRSGEYHYVDVPAAIHRKFLDAGYLQYRRPAARFADGDLRLRLFDGKEHVMDASVAIPAVGVRRIVAAALLHELVAMHADEVVFEQMKREREEVHDDF